jgi:hypothetical protein
VGLCVNVGVVERVKCKGGKEFGEGIDGVIEVAKKLVVVGYNTHGHPCLASLEATDVAYKNGVMGGEMGSACEGGGKECKEGLNICGCESPELPFGPLVQVFWRQVHESAVGRGSCSCLAQFGTKGGLNALLDLADRKHEIFTLAFRAVMEDTYCLCVSRVTCRVRESGARMVSGGNGVGVKGVPWVGTPCSLGADNRGGSCQGPPFAPTVSVSEHGFLPIEERDVGSWFGPNAEDGDRGDVSRHGSCRGKVSG